MEAMTNNDNVCIILLLLLSFFATATFFQYSSHQVNDCRYNVNLEMIY